MLGEVLIKLLVTMLLIMSLVWTLFPWAFGLLNFQQKHNDFLYRVGRVSWWLLIVIHPIFAIWFWAFELSLSTLVCSLLAMHFLFGATFARNVSTQ
ncbi:hypothetical protein [Pseudoalteromonas piscicida]|uniref:Uncharacterized protein n=1 Tax=Pseudoalteromonas piscicida TaxID=43662 RepID=A0A2A5JLM0_PSEO7|nr:hypothetical protein [Pseudoalteromonas piscicida]PCK30344.1 hypothetical protein CEX98_17975 [Pseudoalteromonas piscicida]